MKVKEEEEEGKEEAEGKEGGLPMDEFMVKSTEQSTRTWP